MGRNKISFFLVLLFFAVFLYGLHLMGLTRKIEEFGSYILRPVTKIAYVTNTNISSVFGSLWDIDPSSEETLSQRVSYLENLLVDYENLKKENEILRDQLELTSSGEHDYVLANIIGENPSDFSRTLFLDRGAKDGLKVGMPVVKQDLLLGKLVHVYDYSSELQLITDPRSVVQVYLQESGAKGLLEGSLGLKQLSLTQISKDVEISEGEHILTMGIDLSGVKDLLVGLVESQETEDKSTYQSLKVEQIIDLDTIEKVFIIKN